jgi:hypothetical protein
MPDPTPTPTPTPTPQAPKAKRSVQNTAIASYITTAETLINTASTDADIAPILATHGYDAAEFAIGTGLVKDARDAIGERQTGVGTKLTDTKLLQDAIADARDDYAAFREIARGAFTEQGDRVSLGLTGDVPDDFQKFITAAHTSYVAAGKDPFKTKLTKRSYDAAKLSTLLGNLDALVGTGSGQDESEGDAMGDTAARDAAYVALKDYIKELKATARGALRKQPALLAKLGL